MKSVYQKISLAFLSLIVIGLCAALYLYNKPHTDVKKSEADYVLTAKELIAEYQQNESDTNAKYAESVLQLKGTIFEIASHKGTSVITLKDDKLDSGILCHMLPEENGKALRLEKGQDISIKGICTGYLMDVIMVRCTLVE